ncbi:MAG TPA: carboxypeptidase-like regulatory domain-containing protein, partial [Vicinamibacterales bacterium]
ITATKSGFVDAVYGQRRPLQPGTALQLNDNQQLTNVDLRLTRGSVITGRVLDEDGEALTGAMVTIQRYQYVRGDRQLAPAGGGQTDDRGVYRVFSLPPGDYYVSVSVRGLGQLSGRGVQQVAADIGAVGGRGGRGFGGSSETEQSGYAPTYYPGVVSASEAGRVSVGAGQEVGGIDFQIQLVPLATVGGVVGGTDGTGVTVMLVPRETNARGPLGGAALTGRTMQDGSFTITSVPPGRYLAIARSGGRQSEQRIALQPVVVNGQNIGGLALMLQPEITLSGNITVESSGTPAPTDYSAFRIDAPETSPLPIGGGGRGGPFGTSGRAAANGSFQVPNLVPGRHYIRITGQPAAQGPTQTEWNLKTVLAGGQDVTDTGVDLRSGENVDNVTIVLTDRTTSVSGTVRDAKAQPAAALTVIVFSADPQFWTAQSRYIQAGRTDQNGKYNVHGLPPGDYFVLISDNVEQGEWYDPAFLEQARQGATRLSLNEGEQKTLDLSGPS